MIYPKPASARSKAVPHKRFISLTWSAIQPFHEITTHFRLASIPCLSRRDNHSFLFVAMRQTRRTRIVSLRPYRLLNSSRIILSTFTLNMLPSPRFRASLPPPSSVRRNQNVCKYPVRPERPEIPIGARGMHGFTKPLHRLVIK